ncbi:hypothetical protein K474DRAFT_1666911 [Panus rudis PR-1116 ss-1]|nr:hypothetical protein K474DRAFT_1666911 [Panus rudis PR-1116 ss-1]
MFQWTVQKTTDGKYRVSGASPVGILGTDGVGWLVIPDYTGVEWIINEVRGDYSTYTIETEYAGGNRAWTVPPLGQGTVKVTLESLEDGPTATQRFTFIPANK